MRLFHQTWLIARRILLENLRQGRGLIFWAVFPTLMLLVFGAMYQANPQLGSNFDRTPAGILIGAALFFSCLGGTVSILVAEREHRTLRRLLISPLQATAYFLGLVVALLIIATGQSLLVFGLGAAMGAQFQGSLGLAVLIIGLSVFSYAGLGFFFGSRFAKRTEDVNGPVAAFGVPLLVLGGTFFAPTLLPKFLLDLTWFNPIYHMNEALKAVASLPPDQADLTADLWFLAVFAGVSLVLGATSYHHLLQAEKRA